MLTNHGQKAQKYRPAGRLPGGAVSALYRNLRHTGPVAFVGGEPSQAFSQKGICVRITPRLHRRATPLPRTELSFPAPELSFPAPESRSQDIRRYRSRREYPQAVQLSDIRFHMLPQANRNFRQHHGSTRARYRGC